ncbi:MAG: MarR family transcriptional regulator [Alphaproteobacteria bacterium]|nr:MAG: MarR family transcriptional regulator [Alphaproteobacteria bacterium]
MALAANKNRLAAAATCIGARSSTPQDSDRVNDRSTGNFILDDQIAHLLRRAHQRASASFATALSHHRLTPAQFFALARLREIGQVSQNRLGRLSAMDPATIQGVIKRLGERGYIERLPDPNDRRRMILRLTPAGEQLVDELHDAVATATRRILAPLSAEEQEQLRSLLKRIA